MYVDAVGHAIRQESWMNTEKNVSLGVSEGSKETTQPSPLQVYRNQRSGRRLGFQSRKPIVRTSQVGLVESLRQVVRGRMGWETRVD